MLSEPQGLAVIGMGVLTAFAAWTSLSVFRRYLKSHYTPALLIALAFFLNFVVFPVTLWTLRYTIDGTIAAPEIMVSILRVVSINSIIASTILYGVFTRMVFRRNSSGATLFLVCVCIIIAVCHQMLLAAHPTTVLSYEGPRMTFVIATLAELTIFGWLTYEALAMWKKYKNEVDDTDPLIVNRFLLWGLAGAGYLIALTSNFTYVPGTLDVDQPLFGALKGLGLVLFIGCTYLSWSPPKNYVRMIVRGDDAVED